MRGLKKGMYRKVCLVLAGWQHVAGIQWRSSEPVPLGLVSFSVLSPPSSFRSQPHCLHQGRLKHLTSGHLLLTYFWIILDSHDSPSTLPVSPPAVASPPCFTHCPGHSWTVSSPGVICSTSDPKCTLLALWTPVLPAFCTRSLPPPGSWLLPFHPILSSLSTSCPFLVLPGRTQPLPFGDGWGNYIITCHPAWWPCKAASAGPWALPNGSLVVPWASLSAFCRSDWSRLPMSLSNT